MDFIRYCSAEPFFSKCFQYAIAEVSYIHVVFVCGCNIGENNYPIFLLYNGLDRIYSPQFPYRALSSSPHCFFNDPPQSNVGIMGLKGKAWYTGKSQYLVGTIELWLGKF